MNCPDRDEIERLVSGELDARRHSFATKHLKECEACTEVAAAFRAETEVIRRALLPPPDVEGLIDRVLRQIRDEPR